MTTMSTRDVSLNAEVVRGGYRSADDVMHAAAGELAFKPRGRGSGATVTR
jgi:hypothetical protein